MKTRAALFHAPGVPLQVREIDLAEPRPDELLVRIAAVGICGTDLHVVKGEWQRPTPMVLGHEGSGVVEAVGDDIERLAPGDRVVLSWAPSCGTCADRRRSSPAACLSLQRAIGAGTLLDGTTGMSLDGQTIFRGTATGALSELLVVSEKAALALTADVRLEEAALLGCAALTGVGAVLFVARPEPETTALVIGAGGVGQFVVQGARIAGAAAIVAVDPIEARRGRARELGATHAVPPEDLKATMQEVAPDGADVAFDAVGDPQTSALALRWARNGGTTVLVGLPAAGARLDLDPAELSRREKILTGTMYGSTDPAVALPILLEHVSAGRLQLGSLVGPIYPLDRVNEAVAESLAGSPGRVLVAP
jgi:S-(hydroxymethyl)glutathione dehydrogenase / alcohol dehydrogenase